jgi:hypothetical protein
MTQSAIHSQRWLGEASSLGIPSMTGGDGAFKARGHPPIFCENRLPPRPLARRSAMLRGPDSLASARLLSAVLNQGDTSKEAIMTMISGSIKQTFDPYSALVSGLQIEFGTTETAALAAHFLDAEAADFHWDARQMERHLGSYEALDDDGDELESVKITGVLNGTYFVATCIVDGDGQVRDMLMCKKFTSAAQAGAAFRGGG